MSDESRNLRPPLLARALYDKANYDESGFDADNPFASWQAVMYNNLKRVIRTNIFWLSVGFFLLFGGARYHETVWAWRTIPGVVAAAALSAFTTFLLVVIILVGYIIKPIWVWFKSRGAKEHLIDATIKGGKVVEKTRRLR